MRLGYFKLGLTLVCAVKASAIPSMIDSDSFSFAGPDWRQSNNYFLHNCASNLDQITTALSESISVLRGIVLSTSSTSAAYKAFFKDAPPLTVAAVLDRIEAGGIVDVLPTDRRNRPQRATLVCVNDKASDLAAFWDLCQKSPQTTAFHIANTPLVFLCPKFLTLPLVAENDDCGTLDETNSLFVGDYLINATQYGVLVRALAHTFIPTVLPPEQIMERQVLDVNDCLALPAEQALSNPSSYSFYVTSMIILWCGQVP